MNHVKLYGALLLAAAAIVVIVQNAEAVTVKFLFWQVSMSQALLIPLVLLAGFLIGYIVSGFQRRAQNKDK